MQIRIPSTKEIKQKIVDHPYITYYGFLGVVLVGSYAIVRKTAIGYDPYDFVLEDMYQHMSAGDNLILNYGDEKFYYARFDPDQQAS
jgi:hypothetical protein